MREKLISKIREQIKVLENELFSLDPTDQNLGVSYAVLRSQHFLLSELEEGLSKGDFSDD